MTDLKKIADDLAFIKARAAKLGGAKKWAYDDIRDYADLRTGSELDCTQLDILAGMIMDRLGRAR